MKRREVCDIFLHDKAVLCLSVDPKQSHIFVSASESGEVCLFDLRLSNTEPIVLASSRSFSSRFISSYNSCCFNPVESNLLAIGNETSGLSVIDIRMKSTLIRYKSASSCLSSASEEPDDELCSKNNFKQNIMSVQFNESGKQLAAIRANLRPVIYELNDSNPKVVFDHQDYRNKCTLKSGCFAGDKDQYFVTGSDDFSVFVWKIPVFNELADENGPILISDVHLKLKSHRSIVNQCRYNKQHHMIASSGIEKLIKVWTPYKLPNNNGGGLLGREDEYEPKRELLRRQDINLPSFQLENHNNVEKTEEDMTMIGYFDLQINRQRRIEEKISASIVDSESADEESTDSEDETSDDESSDRTTSSRHSELSESSESDSLERSTSAKTSQNNKWNKMISSSSNESSSDSELSDDLNIDQLLCSSKTNLQKEVKTKSNNSRKLNISLRNRLRNLRHRKSLNLTQQSDYINVLDSLNVKNITSLKEEMIEEKNPILNIDFSSIEVACTSAGASADKIHINDEFECDEHLARANINTSLHSVKSLNNQKRRINTEDDLDLIQTDNNKNISSSQSSDLKDSTFKKLKSETNLNPRNYRRKRKDDELSSSSSESENL